MSDSSLGVLAASSIWAAIASSDSSSTKSPLQYICRPGGSSGSNMACTAGNGIMPIQSSAGGGTAASSGAHRLRPSSSEPL